ncbi:MAG: leucine-rich repeat protein [Lachnospiraceae bacterium]|nr:leucine-rich repeat protein [Lachnospiraceae bacterium]
MIVFIVFLLLYLILMLFPFRLTKGVHYDDGMEKSLIVKSDNTKDARYFSKSFRKLMENAKELYVSNTKNGEEFSTVESVKLSKDETVFFWNGEEPLGEQINNICYVKKEITFNNKMTFEKEVFAEKNIEFSEKTKIRAVAGDEIVIIGEKSKIGRWADAEKLLVLKKESDAGKSISSGDRLVMEPDCVFTRLYAPVIEVKQYIRVVDKDADEVVINKDAPVYMKLKRNLKRIEPNQELKNTIITKHDLTIEPGAIVYGDIKSDKMVHIKNNAVVTGNVFGDESVIIEQGAKVLGNVFAGENLYIGPDVTIGKTGRIKSALSRVDMVISEGAVIYGYAGCENKGRSVARDNFASEVNALEDIKVEDRNFVRNKKADAFEYIKCNITKEGFLNLDDLNHYEKIDYYAFRECDILTKVKLPEGATVVEESMFYGCDDLETVIIPDSVEEIEHYAFFGCKNLKNVVIGENSRLQKIGDYAFAQCDSLEKVRFINLEEIGYAAFWDSDELKEVELVNKAALRECAPNAFQGCTKFDKKEMIRFATKEKEE